VPSSASSEINIATRPSLVYHQLRNSDCLFKRFPRAHHVLLLFSLAPKHTPTVKCLPRLPPQMRYISPRPEAFFLSHPKPSRSQPYIRNAAVLTLMFFCFSLSLSLFKEEKDYSICLSLLLPQISCISLRPRGCLSIPSNTFNISTLYPNTNMDHHMFFCFSLSPKPISKLWMSVPLSASTKINIFALRAPTLSHMFKIVSEEVDVLLFFSATKMNLQSLYVCLFSWLK
jgi:hypothetical protein